MANNVFRGILFICCFQFIYGYQVKNGPLLNYRPSWLKKCSRTDPNMNECLTDFFGVMFPELAKGIPDLNINGFEPLTLDQVSVSKGGGAVILAGSFINLTITGPSNSTPTYTEMKIAERKLNFGIYFPLLDIKAKYNLKGHILILPLVGHGNCELMLGGVDTKVKADVSFINVEGRETLRIDSMKVSFTVDKIKIKLDNLFNGNKVLGLTVNTFMNQHGLEIVSELEEPLGESLAEIFTEIINNIFSKIPTDLWLPLEKHEDKFPYTTFTTTIKPEISLTTKIPEKHKEKKSTEIIKDKPKVEPKRVLTEDETIFAGLVDEINS